MKKWLSFLILVLIALEQLYCQYDNPLVKEEFIPKPKLYIGISSGVNNFNGLAGGSLELNISNRVSFAGGLGIGPWGAKATGGLRLYKNYPAGIYLSSSYSCNRGFKNLHFEFYDYDGNYQDFTLDQKPVQLINLALGYQYGLFDNQIRVHAEIGYAISLTSHYYSITGKTPITSDTKQRIDFYIPGGIILGFGGSYGF
jgi:hypothetical protein